MKKVYFSGYYGKKSYGDDLFIYSLIDSFKEKFDINFLSIPIPGAHIKYFMFQNNSNIKNTLKILKFLIFNRNDFIVFAGGSTYKKKKSFSKRFLIDCFKNKKKIIFGAGIGPFNSQKDQEYFYKLFNEYSLIIVRDNTSLNIEAFKKFNRGTDITHNYIAKNFYNIGLRKEHLVGVSFSTSTYATEENFYNHIIENLDSDKTYYLFILNVADSLRDKYWVKKLADTLSNKNINYDIFSINDMSANELLIKMNECSKMYTSRLHASISAYSLKIPQSCQPYAQKTMSFLKDVGFDGDEDDEIVNINDFRFYADLHERCAYMHFSLEKHLNEN